MTGERVGFADASVRFEFFNSVKAHFRIKTWKEFNGFFRIEKSKSEYYRNGLRLMPEEKFEQFLSCFPADQQTFYKSNVFYREKNWGQVLGGLRTSSMYPEEFAKRRQNGLKKLLAQSLEHFKAVDLNMPLSEELCELLGAIIGDGCIDSFRDKNGKSKYRVFLTGHSVLDKHYLSEYQATIGKEIFDANPMVYFRKNKQAMTLNFFSKPVFTLLTERFGFPAGAKTFTVKIPEEIMNSEDRLIFATIRGIFDTDGCIFFDKRKKYNRPYPRLNIETVSRPLFEQLEKFLRKHFSVYAGKRGRTNTFFIELYGHQELEKWMELIGFSNQKHLNRLAKGVKEKPIGGLEPPASTSSDNLCIPMLRS